MLGHNLRNPMLLFVETLQLIWMNDPSTSKDQHP